MSSHTGDTRGDKLGTLGTQAVPKLGTLGTTPLEGVSLSPGENLSRAAPNEPAATVAAISPETGGVSKPKRFGRPFPKGVSGNPSGRPAELAEVRQLAREHGPEAIHALVRLMRTSKSPRLRLAAANSILDRGYGRAPLEISGPDGGPISVAPAPTEFTDLEVARRIAFLLTQGVRSLPEEPADLKHGEPQANRDHDLQRSSEIPDESDTCDPSS